MFHSFPARLITGVGLALLITSGSWASTTDFTNHFTQGLDYFNQKRYEDARGELFMAMAIKENDSATLKHLALASFMVKDYPQARNLAAQYLDISEDADILVLLGRSSELNGDLELAANIYRKLATTSNPYKQAAQKALERLLSGQGLELRPPMPRPQGLHGSAVAALESDSNISTTYDQVGLPSSIKDTRTTLLFATDYDAHVGDRYYMGLGGLVYGNSYQDEGQPYETGLARGNLHAGMVGSGWNLKFSLGYDYVEYGHKKELDAVRLATSLVKLFSDRFVVLIQGSIADENWVNGESDSTRYDIAVDNRFYFNEIAPNTYLRLKYQYLNNDTDDTSIQAYYFDKGTLGFKTTFPALWSLYIAPDISYEKRIYDEPMPITRKDETLEYSVILGKGWSKALSVELLYRHSDTDSNLSLFDKKQEVFGLSVISTF